VKARLPDMEEAASRVPPPQVRAPTLSQETAILLPNNQRQHRNSHAPKNVLPKSVFRPSLNFQFLALAFRGKAPRVPPPVRASILPQFRYASPRLCRNDPEQRGYNLKGFKGFLGGWQAAMKLNCAAHARPEYRGTSLIRNSPPP